MQIKKIKINDLEAKLLIEKIVSGIDFSIEKQKVTFDFSKINPNIPERLIEVESTFKVYSEGYIEPETNAEIITQRNIYDFKCDIFYDGVGVKIDCPVDIENEVLKYVYI
jgi:hypothetical protein